MQLDPIALKDRQVVRQLRLHQDAVLHHLAVEQADDLEYRLVDRQRFLARRWPRQRRRRSRDCGVLLMNMLFSVFPFLLKFYADSGYQGRSSKKE